MVIIGKPLTFRYYPYPDTTPYITRMPHLHYTVRKTGIGHRTETLSININVHLNHLAYPPGHVVFFFCLLFSPANVFLSQSFPISPFLPLRRGVFFFKRRWRGRTMGEHCPGLTVLCGIIAVYLGLGACCIKSSVNSKSLHAVASKTLPWAARTVAHRRKHPPSLIKPSLKT